MWIFLAAACTEPGGAALGPEPAVPELRVDPGWTIGDAERCDAPVEARWTDVSEAWVGDDSPWDDLRPAADQQGCVAIERAEDGYTIVETAPAGLVAWQEGRGEVARLGGEAWDGRVDVVDLDGDGRLELVAYNHGYTGDDGALLAASLSVAWAGFGPGVVPEALPLPAGTAPADVATLDVDGDGRLDLFLATIEGATTFGRPAVYLGEEGGLGAPLPILATDVTWGSTFDVAVWDADGDGDRDLYRCNDLGDRFGGNALLLLEDGALVETRGNGLDVAVPCMGASVGDVDGDGAVDVFLTESDGHRLLLAGEGGWYDATAARLPYAYADEQMGWGSAVVDMDNDGVTDVLVATADDLDPSLGFPVLFFRGAADGTFTEEGAARGLPQSAATRGLVARDLNGDGVRDLVAGDWTRPPWVLVSEGCTEEAWLEVEAPAGARVTVRGGGRIWTAVVAEHDGFCGSGPAVAHLGLGEVAEVDEIALDVPRFGVFRVAGALTTRRRLSWTAG